MKLTRIILLMALIVVAGSCSSDDDNGPAPFVYNKENLTATYNLVYYQSKNVNTKVVDGFDVVTTTVETGDTFNVLVSFDSTNKMISNGTYRISWTKTQHGNTQEGAEIIVLDSEENNYVVKEATSKLIIEGRSYDVIGFSRTGFTLKMTETNVESDGEINDYEEELRFTR